MRPAGAPWADWTPGVLSKDQIIELFRGGYISGVDDISSAVDLSSLDLTLSDRGYSMPEGAVKPSGGGFFNELESEGLVQVLSATEDGEFCLEPRQTYLFKLRERLERLTNSGVFGQATAKSSVGRVDVLARLVVDGMHGYESFGREALRDGNGDLFIEVTSLTFRVKVRPGCSLSQLRFFCGDPESCEVGRGEEAFRCFMKNIDSYDGSLSVDLSPVQICSVPLVGFCSQHPAEEAEPIPLWRAESPPDPCGYWRFVRTDKRGRLTLKKDSFYILRSKEWLALPQGVAVYCRAIDETLGEMRVHYAGFAHPWFGRRRTDRQVGTPLIFEVRGHDVHTSIKDGAKMARLSFYRMSEDAKKEEQVSPYEDQALQLSNFFAGWPASIEVDSDGKVCQV
jgi:dCTP deaminase